MNQKLFRPVTLVVSLALTLFLTFASDAEAQIWRLYVDARGGGWVSWDPPGIPQISGREVTLTAYPRPNWNFDHWEGGTVDGSTENPLVLDADQDHHLTAVFTTRNAVDNLRKRHAVVRVVDAGSNPVPGVDVQVNMRRRAFPFGVSVRSHLLFNPQYRQFVRRQSPRWWDWAVFGNESKWSYNESARDFVSYYDADAMADLLIDWGFTLRGHALFWGVPGAVQQWVKNISDPSELQAEVDERLTDAVTHFAQRFAHWDVNNEMVHGSFFEDRLGPGTRAYLHNQTASLDPGALITVNDYNVIAGGWSTQDYKDLIQQLEAEGAQIDILGVQCHMKLDDTIGEVIQRLDSIAELGYPIWVTEFDVADPDPSVRAQALEDFYRNVFAHPAVEGVMMWGFWAGRHWRGPDAAIVDMDWTLNEAGLRYDALMSEWWTDESGITDASGELPFHGFHGTYDVTLTPPAGNSEVFTVSLAKGIGAQRTTLMLGSGEPADQTPPSPNASEWDLEPMAVSDDAITMKATLATDPSGVEYYFENTTDSSHDSGWLDTPIYTDVGVPTGIPQTYRVKTRDNAVVPNESEWSSERSAIPAPNSNILDNGGFEYGFPDPWAPFGGTHIRVTDEHSSSGNYSCFVGGRSAKWQGVSQDLIDKMNDCTTYDLSADLRLANGASDTVKLVIKQVDGAGTKYHRVDIGTATDTGWTRLSGSFTLNVTGTLTGLIVYPNGPAVGVDFYVDDLSIVPR